MIITEDMKKDLINYGWYGEFSHHFRAADTFHHFSDYEKDQLAAIAVGVVKDVLDDLLQ